MDRTVGDPTFGRVAANSGWLLGANVLILATSLVQGVVLARALGPSAFGVLSIVIALVAVVQQLLSSRVWEAAIKFVIEFRSRGDPQRATAVVKLCYLVDAVAGVVAFAGLVWVADLAARAFAKDASAAGSIRLYALSAILAVPAATSTALLRIDGRFRWLAAQTAGESLTRLAGIVLVVATVGGATRSVLWAYLFAAAVSAVVLPALAHRAAGELGLAPWRASPLSGLRGQYRRILAFMLYSNLSGTSRVFTSRADVLVLGWFADPQSVGLYRLARTLSDPLTSLFDPLAQAVYPEMSRLVHDHDLVAVRRLSGRIRAATSAVVLPACLVVVAAAGWFVPLVFGPSYAGAVSLTRILVWQLVWVPYVWLPGLLLALGRARLVALVNGLDALDYVVLLLILVPPYGAVGAAVATLLRFVLWTGLAMALERRVNPDLERIRA